MQLRLFQYCWQCIYDPAFVYLSRFNFNTILLTLYAVAKLICLKFPKCTFFFWCCHLCICCFLCLKLMIPTYPVSAFQGQSKCLLLWNLPETHSGRYEDFYTVLLRCLVLNFPFRQKWNYTISDYDLTMFGLHLPYFYLESIWLSWNKSTYFSTSSDYSLVSPSTVAALCVLLLWQTSHLSQQISVATGDRTS